MTRGPASVFEKTYRDYLTQIAAKDLDGFDRILGIEIDDNRISVPLFGRPYTLTPESVTDASGRVPPLDTCAILFKYILMCPADRPRDPEWVSYRDFRDSGPLTVYFSHDVEQATAAGFSKNADALEDAGLKIGGYRPVVEAVYDVSLQFDMLPKISILMLFNDADEEFPAHCSVLFERSAERYLDAECLAMGGRMLYTLLEGNRAASSGTVP